MEKMSATCTIDSRRRIGDNENLIDSDYSIYKIWGVDFLKSIFGNTKLLIFLVLTSVILFVILLILISILYIRLNNV